MRKLLLLPFLLAACVEGEPEPTLEVGEHKVMLGTVTDAPEMRAVVLIKKNNGATNVCTGTFVHPYYILTAAHCLDECTNAQPSGCTYVSDPDHVWNGEGMWHGEDGWLTGWWATADVNGQGSQYRIDRVHFARSQDFDAELAPPDMALLRTATPYRGTVIPVMSATPTRDSVCGSHEGNDVTVAGYSNNMGWSSIARRVGAIEVQCDLDGEDRAYMMDGAVFTCPGDSGGPVLWQEGGRPVTGGIVSFGYSTCPSAHDESGAAFIARPTLEHVAGLEPICWGQSWDACVAALQPAEPARMPSGATIRGTPAGIEIAWTDDYGAGTNEVRLTRSPSPVLWQPTWTPQNGVRRTFVDPWGPYLRKDTFYSYTLCSTNTLREEACVLLTWSPPPAAPGAQNVVVSEGQPFSVLYGFTTSDNGQMSPDVRVYRDDLGDSSNRALVATYPLGESVQDVDTGVNAYRQYRYDICTASSIGDETCVSRQVSTYAGTPQCPQGKILCGGVCKPVWQCDFWE